MLYRRVLPVALALCSACAASPAPPRPAAVQVDAATASSELAPAPGPAPVSTGARLEICRIDDELDPFDALTAPATLPEGVSIEAEQVPLGMDHGVVKYARLTPAPGESPGQARARLERWLRSVPLPQERRFGIQLRTVEGPDGQSSPTDLRTYVLWSRCELDDTAIETARIGRARDFMGWQLSIELTRSGSDTFAALTEAMLRRRLALVLDGMVAVAPTVMARIGGGRIQISLGAENIDLPLQFSSGVPIERD